MEHLVISILSSNNHNLWSKIAQLIADQHCQITQAQGQSAGMDDTLSMVIAGNWNDIAKLEDALRHLSQELSFQLIQERSKPAEPSSELLPYIVQVIALDKTETIHNISYFFSSQDIRIETFNCETYHSINNHTPMLLMNLSLSVPYSINIAELREDFIVLCDDLNVDGILEPEKR